MRYGDFRVLEVNGSAGVLRALAEHVVTGERRYIVVDLTTDVEV